MFPPVGNASQVPAGDINRILANRLGIWDAYSSYSFSVKVNIQARGNREHDTAR